MYQMKVSITSNYNYGFRRSIFKISSKFSRVSSSISWPWCESHLNSKHKCFGKYSFDWLYHPLNKLVFRAKKISKQTQICQSLLNITFARRRIQFNCNQTKNRFFSYKYLFTRNEPNGMAVTRDNEQTVCYNASVSISDVNSLFFPLRSSHRYYSFICYILLANSVYESWLLIVFFFQTDSRTNEKEAKKEPQVPHAKVRVLLRFATSPFGSQNQIRKRKNSNVW